MALNPMTRLPHAMLIDLDDTILSAHGRPRWHRVASEFAPELAPSSPREVATAILAFARNFWSTAELAWRLKLGEARRLSVKGGFAALAASGHAALSDDLAIVHGDDDTAAGAKAENRAFPRPGSRVVPP
jgi:putative hydrolase of the HAD superfamily